MMNQRKNQVLIISGGKVEEEVIKQRLQKSGPLIIAADRGLVVADKLHLTPDYIVGDFDSVPAEILGKYKELEVPIMTYPSEKDVTDTEIAIELALELGATSIELVGVTGSRMDHMLANIHLLLPLLEKQIETFILDEKNRLYLKNKNFVIEKKEQYGNYVSLLPFYKEVRGLTIKGFKYPLSMVDLQIGTSLGVSNEIVEDVAEIEITDGVLVVIESKD